jgi:hypothetical protein
MSGYLQSKYSRLLNHFETIGNDLEIQDTGSALILRFNHIGSINLVMIRELKHQSHLKKTLFGKPKTIDVLVTKWNHIQKGKQISFEYSEFMDRTNQKVYFEVLLLLLDEKVRELL